jgi:hypothetical protein
VDLTETGLCISALVSTSSRHCDEHSEFNESRESIGKASNFKLTNEGSAVSDSLLISHVHVGRLNLLY